MQLYNYTFRWQSGLMFRLQKGGKLLRRAFDRVLRDGNRANLRYYIARMWHSRQRETVIIQQVRQRLISATTRLGQGRMSRHSGFGLGACPGRRKDTRMTSSNCSLICFQTKRGQVRDANFRQSSSSGPKVKRCLDGQM